MKEPYQVLFGPDEGGGGGDGDSGESSNDQPPSKPQMPSDDMEVTLPSGEIVTYGELKSGYTRTADYTVKTQEAAEAKRQADAAMAEAAAIKAEAEGSMAKARKIRAAMKNDLAWYQAHPDTKDWQQYDPEVFKVDIDDDGGGSSRPAAPPAPDPEVKKLREDVDRLTGTLTKREREEAVDDAIAVVNSTAGSEGYELVTPKLLYKAVQAHQATNKGALPDAKAIRAYAKEIHEEIANQGVPIPKGVKPASDSTKPKLPSSVATSLDPKHKSLNLKSQGRQVEQELAKVMKEMSAARD